MNITIIIIVVGLLIAAGGVGILILIDKYIPPTKPHISNPDALNDRILLDQSLHINKMPATIQEIANIDGKFCDWGAWSKCKKYPPNGASIGIMIDENGKKIDYDPDLPNTLNLAWNTEDGVFAKYRKRVCQCPAPQGSGITCQGETIEFSPCQEPGRWETTNVSDCINNSRTVTRECVASDTNGKPIFSPTTCQGETTFVESCKKYIKGGVTLIPCDNTNCNIYGTGVPLNIDIQGQSDTDIYNLMNSPPCLNADNLLKRQGIALSKSYGISGINIFDGQNCTGNKYTIDVAVDGTYIIPANENQNRIRHGLNNSIAITNLTGLDTVASYQLQPRPIIS